MHDTDAFYTPEPTRYTFTKAPDIGARRRAKKASLTFRERLRPRRIPRTTPSCARYFPADPILRNRKRGQRRAARSWCWRNGTPTPTATSASARSCQKLGIASLRISLPYHDARMPPELTRADYIVSSNIVRTLQVCRQAVRDVRLALWWLRDQGYERLGLLGTSLGSCLSYLTTVSRAAGAGAGAQSRLAVFRRRGVARPVDRARARGLDGHVDIDQLRELWRPISPWSFLDRLHDKQTLMVYAKYDLTFPVDLSLQLINENQPPRLFRCEVARVAVRSLLDRRRRRSSISTAGISGNFCATQTLGQIQLVQQVLAVSARSRRRSIRRATGPAATLRRSPSIRPP